MNTNDIQKILIFQNMVVVVVKSSANTNANNNTASHLYMKYNTASLRNSEKWRDKLLHTRTKARSAAKPFQEEKGEKGEKGEKEIENQIFKIEQKDEKTFSLSLDVNKVINNLSIHLEKTQLAERKEKTIDKKKGNIIYNTKDGRVLQAFHSCERGKIIWEDNVYNDLKSWLAAASVVAPCRCD